MFRVLWHPGVRLPAASGEQERCGVLLGQCQPSGRLVISRAVEVSNRHPEPDQHFSLLRSDVLDATAHLPGDLVAHWHTHDEPVPASDLDIDGCGTLLGLAFHPESGFSSWYDRYGHLEAAGLTCPRWPVLAPVA